MKIDGVDPLVVNQVINQTARSQVQSSRNIKTISDKKHQEGQQQDVQGQLKDSVERLNKAADAFNIQLHFKIDQEENELYVYVVDIVENKVIRRIPPESFIEAASRMQKMVGLILDALI